MEDTYKLKGLRKRLVEVLEEKGIKQEVVLDAIGKIPRHFFLESAFSEAAYEDRALPIGEGQTISQPFTVAYQTELLDVKPDDKILEIGTGSGYQASILCQLGCRLFSIERNPELGKKAKELLFSLGFKPMTKVTDGTKGWLTFAPYHGIIVTAASPNVPEVLKKQLKIGGKLVIPVGDRTQQKMYLVTRLSEEEYKTEILDSFRFVPLIGEFGWEE